MYIFATLKGAISSLMSQPQAQETVLEQLKDAEIAAVAGGPQVQNDPKKPPSDA